MLLIVRLFFSLFFSVGFYYTGFAENYVCSHIFNGINKINKYEKNNNSQYVQYANNGKKYFHRILFENEKELHLYRRVVKFGSCTTTGSAISIIDKQTLKLTGSAICGSSRSSAILAKCVKF